jgi:hypothetical protein
VPLAAAPTITSVSPSTGPVAGGTIVTIRGAGFDNSPANKPQVTFGGTPARNVTFRNDGTLEVTTPAHFPKNVTVHVSQRNGSASLPDAFTFTGRIEDAFDRVLLPLFTEPVNGAFGSRFVTHLRAANMSRTEGTWVFGLAAVCGIEFCVEPDLREEPYRLEPRQSYIPQDFDYTGKPGQFLYIPKNMPDVSFNLRVFDESRRADNFGTELPVVRAEQFTTQPFELLDVPGDPRFRVTLRLYAPAATSVSVFYSDIGIPVDLKPGLNELEPAYAQLGTFGDGNFKYDITIVPSTTVPPFPGFEPVPVWGFISVTNNETQLITTITPQ